jgi:hypothetical protein
MICPVAIFDFDCEYTCAIDGDHCDDPESGCDSAHDYYDFGGRDDEAEDRE